MIAPSEKNRDNLKSLKILQNDKIENVAGSV
jgi:hypothetical protein